MICELQRKWSKTIIKRLNLQTQILSKMQIKLGTALRQSDVMLKHMQLIFPRINRWLQWAKIRPTQQL